MATTEDRAGEARRIPSGRPFRGRVRVPASKSVTNRYLNLALLAGREVELDGPLEAEDTERFAAALRALGYHLDRAPGRWRLEPPPALPASAALHCGASGTMARFLTATLAALPGEWTLDGGPRLRRRPVGPLVAALAGLGAGIEARDRDGFLPLAIRGGTLDGGAVRLDAGESSQYLSALLMAAVRARRPVAIEVAALTSAPYVELTRAAMAAFGVEVERGESGFRVRPTALGGGLRRVPADDSAACYPAAAAALTGGRVELQGLDRDSLQGDRRFLDLLAEMGARVEWRGTLRVVAAGDALRAVEADLGDLPDQVPTLAAIAPFARGVTRIRGVPHLRLKESDRLRAAAEGLRRAGAEVEERPDGLVVPGVWAARRPPGEPVTLDPHDDHRMAMSFALLGLRRPGLRVAGPEVVAKSYPSFWRDFMACLEA